MSEVNSGMFFSTVKRLSALITRVEVLEDRFHDLEKRIGKVEDNVELRPRV